MSTIIMIMFNEDTTRGEICDDECYNACEDMDGHCMHTLDISIITISIDNSLDTH